MGDEILTLEGSVTVITGSEIEKFDETILVYNLEVADFNTYFVGDKAVLVHNYYKKINNDLVKNYQNKFPKQEFGKLLKHCRFLLFLF